MSEGKVAIAVHACGFKSFNEICEIAKLRLTEALKQASLLNISDIIISGGPPYQTGSKFLAHLMGKWLIEQDVQISFEMGQTRPSPRIHYATDCFDSSTDIKNILKIAQEQHFDRILAISSYWHLRVLKLLYKYWAGKLNYSGSIITIPNGKVIDRYLTSKKTRIIYFFYAGLVRLSLRLCFFEYLDKFLSSKLSKRKNGSPVSGCS